MAFSCGQSIRRMVGGSKSRARATLDFSCCCGAPLDLSACHGIHCDPCPAACGIHGSCTAARTWRALFQNRKAEKIVTISGQQLTASSAIAQLAKQSAVTISVYPSYAAPIFQDRVK